MTNEQDQGIRARRAAVLFDVDGTLCDVRSIRKFVDGTGQEKGFKPDFKRFHASSMDCPPHSAVKALALRAHANGLAIIVVTGREARWKDLTEAWLAQHAIPYDALWTRPANDYRPDHVVKAELELEIRQRFRPLLAVDDRVDIIAIWQAAGISTVQVAVNGALMKPIGNVDSRLADLLSEME